MSDSAGTPQEVRYTLAPTRLGPIREDQMTAAQKATVDAVMSGPRKHMGGPFSALLRSPELMNRVQKVGEQRVIDILAVAGYYGLLALVMNVARTPVPEGHALPLPALPLRAMPKDQ